MSKTNREFCMSFVIKIASILFSCQIITAQAAEPKSLTYAGIALTAEQASADVALMRAALEEAHPGLYRYVPKQEIEAAFAKLEKRVKTPITDVELYGEISLLLATIRCDHTKAEFSEAMTKFRNESPTHLPFRFKLFDKRMFVFGGDVRAALPRGTEILAINDQPVRAILDRLANAISIDGFTDASRQTKLAADSDLMGSDFDQFYPVFYDFTPTFKLSVMMPNETQVKTVTLDAITFRKWVKLPWQSTAYRNEFYKSIDWKLIGNKTAILKIDTFVNYRNPVDPAAFYAGFFKVLNNAKVEHLIIDLRENGGGSGDTNVALVSFLLDKPFVWNKPIQQKAIRFGAWSKYVETWGNAKEIFEPPVENFRKLASGFYERITSEDTPDQRPNAIATDRFQGRVTVLSSPVNASGTTMLIAKLKDEKRITVIGEATGGSAEGPTAGRLFFLKLPNSGITVRVPNYWNLMSIGAFTTGKGVAPDEEVIPTLDDFLAGKDRVLDIAKARVPTDNAFTAK
jgi:C-terminal processing protease CtpA/Prc